MPVMDTNTTNKSQLSGEKWYSNGIISSQNPSSDATLLENDKVIVITLWGI